MNAPTGPDASSRCVTFETERQARCNPTNIKASLPGPKLLLLVPKIFLFLGAGRCASPIRPGLGPVCNLKAPTEQHLVSGGPGDLATDLIASDQLLGPCSVLEPILGIPQAMIATSTRRCLHMRIKMRASFNEGQIKYAKESMKRLGIR